MRTLRQVPLPPGPLSTTTGRDRSDIGLPLMAAAFALGVVVAATAALGLHVGGGDTVPARTHADTLAQLAGEHAARVAAERQLASQDSTLTGADTLAHRLVTVLAAQADGQHIDLDQLRRLVDRQTTRIETVRVVRVPTPAGTTAPAARTSLDTARRAGAPSAAPTVAPAPTPGCHLEVLGACLTR